MPPLPRGLALWQLQKSHLDMINNIGKKSNLKFFLTPYHIGNSLKILDNHKNTLHNLMKMYILTFNTCLSQFLNVYIQSLINYCWQVCNDHLVHSRISF